MDEKRPQPDSANLRYIRNLAKRDWLADLQTAYLKQRVALRHARTKSHYVRYFGVAAINVEAASDPTNQPRINVR